MKAIKNIGALAIVTALLFGSCSVEKRRYRPGYNVDAGKKAPKTEAIAQPAEPVKEDKTTIIIPEYSIPPAAQEDVAQDYTKAYNIYVVVGPRPDKKAKKKYPMGM